VPFIGIWVQPLAVVAAVGLASLMAEAIALRDEEGRIPGQRALRTSGKGSDLLWVLPSLACGYSSHRLPFPEVRGF
jgi:hypothetical protein